MIECHINVAAFVVCSLAKKPGSINYMKYNRLLTVITILKSAQEDMQYKTEVTNIDSPKYLRDGLCISAMGPVRNEIQPG